MDKIELNAGKYTVVNELGKGGGFHALRYGEKWRSLAGDNLVLAMFHEIEELRERLDVAEGLLLDARDSLDDVHCYETEMYELITEFLYGDNDDD